uniref:Plant heme peroxidase family profile domain-containing protein n=1 Tax=Helicotheca tamesis TaxID=374047 RepID=A0A7S2HYW0_9STRA
MTNDFFVNLMDCTDNYVCWKKATNDAAAATTRNEGGGGGLYDAYNAQTGERLKWKASEVDLIFASNAELRAIAEYYACDNSRFVEDFVNAWVKVMELDRFDLDSKRRGGVGGGENMESTRSRL